jgi:HK97 family phage prohead protease
MTAAPHPPCTPVHEVKFTALDLKAVDADGAFEGYASLFDKVDLGRDVIAPGAFRDSLAARGPQGVKLLYQHDPGQPIGVWQSLREDSRGLHAVGRLMPEVTRAREVLSLMRAGALDGLSIGFRAVKAKRDARTGIRRLEKVDLWEISVVTFPMLPEARVASVKGGPFAGRVPTEREFERWLTRDAGLTRSQARAVIRSGLKGLQAWRDAGRGGSEEDRLAARIRDAAHLFRTQRQ